jgi:hypothetical protein
MDDVEFKPWPKTPRPKGDRITITEKLDGTNGCLIIRDGELVGVQSRNRMIKVGDDNFGFAAWAYGNAALLGSIGDGYHYGEWVGPGIQSNQHNLEDKAFFLFNTDRPLDTLPTIPELKQVPVLYSGENTPTAIPKEYNDLNVRAFNEGYRPEGIIVYYYLTKQRVKYTYANQEGKFFNDLSS